MGPIIGPSRGTGMGLLRLKDPEIGQKTLVKKLETETYTFLWRTRAISIKVRVLGEFSVCLFFGSECWE